MSVKHFCDVASLRITRDGATTPLYKADRGGTCRWIAKHFSRLQGITPTVTWNGSNYYATATITGVVRQFDLSLLRDRDTVYETITDATQSFSCASGSAADPGTYSTTLYV